MKANLSHLCQVQGGTLLLGIFRPPALHTDLFVVQHARVGLAPRQTTRSPRSQAGSPPQFWSRVWRAGLLPLQLWEADLLVGEGQGPEEVVMMRGRRGRGDWRGGELRVGRQSLVEERQVQGSLYGDAGT